MNASLLITGIQNDFFEGGAMPVKNASDIIPIINKIRTEYGSLFCSTMTIQDSHPETHISFVDSPYASEENLPFDEVTLATKGKFPRHCIQGTIGANFHPELFLNGNEIILKKGENKFKEELSGFANPVLIDLLKANEINTVFIIGLTFEFGVGLTAIDCANKGFTTYVIKEATKSMNEASYAEMEKSFKLNHVKFITLAEFEEIMKVVAKVKEESTKKEDTTEEVKKLSVV